MLTRKRCCCGGSAVDCLDCSPCPIPKKDLSLTITSGLYGAGSATLTFDGTSTWSGSWSFVGGLTHFTFNAILTCLGSNIQFCINDGNPADNCCNNGVGLHLHAFTCGPFHLDFDFDSILTVVCDNDQSLGFSHFLIDDDASTVCQCNGIHVNGCNGLSLADADVVIKDSGGGTVDSGTTNALGNLVPAVTGLGYELDISKTRFNTNAFTNQTIGCGNPLTLSMAGHVASGYQCYQGCADPIAETLTVTFSLAGALTLTYSGGVWIGTFTVAGQSYTVFLSNITHVFGIQRNGSDCSGVVLIVDSCPPSFSAAITIASGTCATELGSTGVLTE